MTASPVRPSTNGRKTGVTIGNFDGVHRGHQLLVHRTLEICRDRDIDCVAVTFWPHPRSLFSGIRKPPLADVQTRRRLLGELGVPYLLELSFTRQIAALSPEEFYLGYLRPLRLSSLVVGYDFCLGKGRSGNYEALRELGKKHGFSVDRVPPLLLGDAPVSSTRLRSAIEAGDVALAARMLGRPHAVYGPVVHGQGRGAGLGFPTANVRPRDVLLPPDGVYATRVTHRGLTHPAVTNIGFTPTFDGAERTIESFLLDGDLNLYGEEVGVEFLRRLRPERRFPSVQALTEQIAKDVSEARRINALPLELS